MEKIPMSFIRAPAIVSSGEGVEVLSSFNGMPTAVREGNMTALAYHPELLDDCRICEWFLAQIKSRTK